MIWDKIKDLLIMWNKLHFPLKATLQQNGDIVVEKYYLDNLYQDINLDQIKPKIITTIPSFEELIKLNLNE